MFQPNCTWKGDEREKRRRRDVAVLAKEEERRTMGSAGEGMKCEGGFFATVSSRDAVKNSEQISRWGVAAGWLLLNCRSQVGNRGPTIKGDKGGCKGKRGRVYRQIERKSSGVRVKLGGRRRCERVKRGEKSWGEGKGEGQKRGRFPFCGAIVALFSLQPLERFPSYQLDGCKHLGEFFSTFFLFFGWRFEIVSRIFEDEYYSSILYDIDTIFKILGWKKKIFGACFDAFRIYFEYFYTVSDFYL